MGPVTPSLASPQASDGGWGREGEGYLRREVKVGVQSRADDGCAGGSGPDGAPC